MSPFEFSTTLKRTRRWSSVVYAVGAVTLMLLIVGVGYIYSSEIQKLTLAFRDKRMAVEDDGSYGAIVGLLIGALFILPSTVLPLFLVAIADRSLGTACPVCHSSLTLWNRGNKVLRTGHCVKCSTAVLRSGVASNEDEQAAQPERRFGWIGHRRIVRRRPVSLVVGTVDSRYNAGGVLGSARQARGSVLVAVSCSWSRGMLGRVECS